MAAQIYAPGPQPVPETYTVPATQELVMRSVSAQINGSGASGDFLACLAIYSQAGNLIARVPTTTIVQGDSAEVTWAPFLDQPPTPAAAGFIPALARLRGAPAGATFRAAGGAGPGLLHDSTLTEVAFTVSQIVSDLSHVFTLVTTAGGYNEIQVNFGEAMHISAVVDWGALAGSRYFTLGANNVANEADLQQLESAPSRTSRIQWVAGRIWSDFGAYIVKMFMFQASGGDVTLSNVNVDVEFTFLG